MPAAGRATTPDLVVSSLAVSPASAAPGDSIDIVSEIKNVGAVAVGFRGSSTPSTGVRLRLVTNAADLTGGTPLGNWDVFVGMAPGSVSSKTTRAVIPASTPPGAYLVCADADGDHLVTESDESNNRLCKRVTVVGPAAKAVGPPKVSLVLPDLVITDVSAAQASGVSRLVKITVKNAGNGYATRFRMDAYQLEPTRWPLILSACALLLHTSSCPSLWEESLAAGASRTYTGWVTFPPDRGPGSGQRVEFIVDGCSPLFDPGLPASCRVLESNESNNTWVSTVIVP